MWTASYRCLLHLDEQFNIEEIATLQLEYLYFYWRLGISLGF